MTSIEVHCPQCGKKVWVNVVIDTVKRASRTGSGWSEVPTLEVSFDPRWVDHTCEES